MTAPATGQAPAIAIAAITWAGLVVLAWLSPIGGDDWDALLRADHGWTPAALLHQLLATSRVAHVALAPLIVVAALAGAAVVVTGRRDAPDPVAFAVVAATLWIGCPRLGVVLTHRPVIAHHVLALAAALWLFVPVRTGTWTYGGGVRLAIAALLGLVAGAGPLVIAAPTLAALVAPTVFEPRVRSWTLPAAAGAAAGVIWGATAGTTTSSISAGSWIVLLHQTGELVMWTALVLTVALVASRLRRTSLPTPPPAELAVIGWLALLATASLVIAATAGKPDAAALFTPTALLALAGARAVLLVIDGATRRAFAAVAVAVHLVSLAAGIDALDDAAAQAASRDAALRRAEGVAVVPPIRPVTGDFWTLGDDLAAAARRARIASHHGLTDIAVEPRFRAYEP